MVTHNTHRHTQMTDDILKSCILVMSIFCAHFNIKSSISVPSLIIDLLLTDIKVSFIKT